MSDYFVAGGWGMYPVTLFGFLLVAVTALHALRPRPVYARLALVLGIATFMAGLLGTATGISATAHYIQHVAQPKQVEIFALGLDESLHDLVLSMILVVVACLIATVGVLRNGRTSAPAAA